MEGIVELNKRNQWNLNNGELFNIMLHSSYQPQEEEVRNHNKNMVVYGRSVVGAILSFYGYVIKKICDAGELSTFINSNTNLLIKEIYETYEVKTYEIVCLGEQNNVHHDTAAKLIALYYRTHGFIDTYNWLYTSIRILKVNQNQNQDYKTILQTYANKNKLPLQYETIGSEGPDNDCTFICELTVGKEKVVAKEKSKKGAQKEAAHQYLLKRHIPTNTNTKIQRRHIDNQAPLDAKRKKQIIEINKMLNIGVDELSMEYISAAFVHKSIQNSNHLKMLFADNSVLTVIGSYLLPIYTFDYLMDSKYYKYFDMKKEVATYVNTDTLNQALPSKWFNYLLALGTVNDGNLTGNRNIKKEIFHSILAVLIIFAFKEKSIKSQLKAKKVAYAYLKSVEEHRNVDCISALHQAADVIELQVEKEISRKEGTLEHLAIFTAKLSCHNDSHNIVKEAEGVSKVTATNEAARKILLELIECEKENIKLQKLILQDLNREKFYQLCINDEKIKQEDRSTVDTIVNSVVTASLEQIENCEFDEMELSILRNLCM